MPTSTDTSTGKKILWGECPMVRAIVLGIIGAIVVLLVALQAVPYGRNHTNPPVRMEPAWDSPATRALAVRACFDCHSNETVWPWYSDVAPIAWLVQRDVDKGRRELNFSEWDRPPREAREAAESIQKGKMPPSYYLLRPDATLSPTERDVLVRGLQATLGQGDGRGQQERGRD